MSNGQVQPSSSSWQFWSTSKVVNTKLHVVEASIVLMVGILVCLCTFVRVDFSIVENDLDSAYSWAFNYLGWSGNPTGTDSIFTFGPYGFLMGRRFHFGSQSGILFSFQLFLSLIIPAVIAKFVFKGLRSFLIPQRLVAYFAILWSILLATEYQLLCLVILLALLKESGDRKPRRMIDLTIGFIVALSFLIKVSLGINAAIFAGSAAFLFAKGPREKAVTSLFYLLWTLGVSLFLWALAGRPLLEFAAYIQNSFDVASGYASAMSNYVDLSRSAFWLIGEKGSDYYWQWIFLVCLLALTVVLLLFTYLPLLRQNWRLLTIVFPLYLVMRHSLTRLGAHHLLHYSFFALFCFLVLFSFSEARVRWNLSRVILASVFIFFLSIPLRAARYDGTEVFSPWINASHFPVFKQFESMMNLDGLRHAAKKLEVDAAAANHFPKVLRSILGQHPVDIFPYQLHVVPFENLNWINRPVPVTFQSYTPRLDRLNERHFLSSRAPEYILFNTKNWFEDIHPFWAEPLTYEVIERSYELAQRSGDWLLLKKKIKIQDQLTRERLSVQTLAQEEWLDLPTDKHPDLILKLTRKPNLLLNAKKAFFREEPMFIRAKYKSGVEKVFRFLPEQATGGIKVASLPMDGDDFQRRWSGESHTVPVKLRIEGRTPTVRLPRFEAELFSQSVVGSR